MIKTSVNTGVMSSGKVGVKRGVFICKNIYNRYSDLDAKQFMYASGISNNQIKDAIYRLCIDLKMAGIFDKCQAIYPFVGGTATTHRFNLRDPRDLDAAFRLQFFGGGTHSANGYSGNGSNAYADTFLSTSNLINNNHLSIYIRTNVNEVKVDIGAYESLPTGRAFDIESRITNLFYGLNFIPSVNPSFANTDSRGFYLNTRTTSTNHKIYKNGTLQVTSTSSGTSVFTRNILIAARNESGTPSFFASKQYAFVSIGTSLTDAEAATYNTIVQSFQTTLGRNV